MSGLREIATNHGHEEVEIAMEERKRELGGEVSAEWCDLGSRGVFIDRPVK